jgi:hypothetical protein
MAWFAGKHPSLKIIFASYSDELGTSANRYLFRTISSNNVFCKMFPDLHVGAADWAANISVIEFVRQAGSFRNTTVEGTINGFRLDLGVIDDPIKGSAEANSKVQRDKIWEWFTKDFLSRLDQSAGLLIAMTRWQVDDPVGEWPNTSATAYACCAIRRSPKQRIGGGEKY